MNRMIDIIVIALILVLASLPAACSSEQAPSNQRTVLQSDRDDRRPIEDSESLPGYLTDPDMIDVVMHSDGSMTIEGAPGAAIVNTPGTLIVFWDVNPAAAGRTVKSERGRLMEASKRHEIPVHEDGSFQFSGHLEVGSENMLGISVGGAEDDEHVWVQRAKTGEVNVSAIAVGTLAIDVAASPAAMDPDDTSIFGE